MREVWREGMSGGQGFREGGMANRGAGKYAGRGDADRESEMEEV